MGAAFVVTGTVNQMCREAGTSDFVRDALRKASNTDVAMAPAADMFSMGVNLQCVQTPFVGRAKRLYDVFLKYNSIDAIPPNERASLERTIFKKPLTEIWAETEAYYRNRLKDHDTLQAALADPKLQLELCCKWYLSKSSGFAQRDVEGRRMDAQIWCGPCIGSFNAFIEGSATLDSRVLGQFPSVVDVNMALLHGACYLERLALLQRFIKGDTAATRKLRPLRQKARIDQQ